MILIDGTAKAITMTIMLTLVLTAAIGTSPLFAGGASEQSCKTIGVVMINCYDCRTNTFLGSVRHQTRYQNATDKCIDYPRAQRACSDTYDVPSEHVAFSFSYTLSKFMGIVDAFKHSDSSNPQCAPID